MFMLLGSLMLLSAVGVDGDEDVEAALKRYRKASLDANPAVRALAVTELSKIPHERTLDVIASLLTSEEKDIRLAAAKALGGFDGFKKAAVPCLISALGSNRKKDFEIESAIYAALGRLQDPTAMATIHQGIRDKHPDTAKAAIAAAGLMRAKESLDVLYELLQDIQKWIKTKQNGGYHDGGPATDPAAKRARLEEIHGSIIQALQAITRENWKSVQEWDVWFRRFRPDFKVPK